MSRAKPRVLFMYQKAMSFVKDDMEVLGQHFDVVPFEFCLSSPTRVGKLFETANLIRKQRKWLAKQLPQADAVFGWFLDVHMGLPVRMAKERGVPIAISVGGYDAMDIPQLSYGVYGSWRSRIARYAAHSSDVLLPVAPSLIETNNEFLSAAQNQGLKVHIPDLQTRIEVVPTGYVADDWKPGPTERSSSVLSVAMVDSDRTFRRKGLDLLIETARLMPEVPFTVIGIDYSVAEVVRRYKPPANVQLLPPQPRKDLLKAYQTASVYLQVSQAEGMPNVLCEAMLCGCIPVGSSAFGIPTAIGNAGFIVERPDPGVIVESIRKAFSSDLSLRDKARQRIADNFSRLRREIKLLKILHELTDQGQPRS